jgi:hypothetical protein
LIASVATTIKYLKHQIPVPADLLMQVKPNPPALNGVGAVNSNHSFLAIGSMVFF